MVLIRLSKSYRYTYKIEGIAEPIDDINKSNNEIERAKTNDEDMLNNRQYRYSESDMVLSGDTSIDPNILIPVNPDIDPKILIPGNPDIDPKILIPGNPDIDPKIFVKITPDKQAPSNNLKEEPLNKQK